MNHFVMLCFIYVPTLLIYDHTHMHTYCTTPSPCSHYQLVVVKLVCPTSNIDSNPDEMFPNPEDLPLYDDHQVDQAYIAAEIDAGKLNLATSFVIGDENHDVAQMNDVAGYRNGPLEPEACYSFFMRGFLSVPQVRCPHTTAVIMPTSTYGMQEILCG